MNINLSKFRRRHYLFRLSIHQAMHLPKLKTAGDESPRGDTLIPGGETCMPVHIAYLCAQLLEFFTVRGKSWVAFAVPEKKCGF